MVKNMESISGSPLVLQVNAIADLYHRALPCRMCFAEQRGLKAPIIDLAQPRWVGSRYFRAKRRITFVMLNPGAGDPKKDDWNQEARKMLLKFRDGDATFSEVLAFQQQHMKFWGRPAGRFLDFYTKNLGLELDEVAFLNIGLCATDGNQYPDWMLKRCFADHSGKILQQLVPSHVVLCGGSARRFTSAIKKLCRDTQVVPMLHHAHREGRSVEATAQKEAARNLKVF
jgi:hypothetical protein